MWVFPTKSRKWPSHLSDIKRNNSSTPVHCLCRECWIHFMCHCALQSVSVYFSSLVIWRAITAPVLSNLPHRAVTCIGVIKYQKHTRKCQKRNLTLGVLPCNPPGSAMATLKSVMLEGLLLLFFYQESQHMTGFLTKFDIIFLWYTIWLILISNGHPVTPFILLHFMCLNT